jgi:glycosyltransferase involved in cell wall biosynthesis
VLEYYQKSDLFVSPYLEKGISKVVLEAMACSLPVIAADSQSARDIFEDNLNILFAKKNDASDLAEKIEKLLLDRKLLENIAKNSRLRAEHFDWNEIAKEYINLYEKTKSLGRIRQGE